MSEEVRVLGYFKGFSDIYKKDYAFVDVIAKYEGGKLIEVGDPYTEFPSDGNFFLHRSTGSPSSAGYGVWILGENPQSRDESKRHQARYMAEKFEKAAVLPLEVLALGLEKSDHTSIGERLISGVELKHTPMPYVLWQLKSGEFIGPVHVVIEGSSSLKLVRVEKSALEKPLGLWAAMPKANLVEIGLRDGIRKFVTKIDASTPGETIDLAGPEDIFRSVLKFAWDKTKGGTLITKNQYKQLVEQLSEFAARPEEMKKRSETVVSLLKESMEAGIRLDELTNFVISHASFKSEIDEVKKNAKVEAEKTLHAEKSEITNQISKLNAQRQEAEVRVRKTEKEIETKKKELLDLPDKVMKAVKEKFEKAKVDPVELLAEVAVFEPFLRRENVASLGTGVGSKKLSHILLVPEVPMATISALSPRDRYIDNLKLLGVQTRQAEQLGTEVFAAIAASRVLSFIGSSASKMASCLSNTIAAGNSFQINVPLGVVGPDELSTEMDTIIGKIDGNKASVIVINGANRSAIELFGDKIRDIALESLFENDFSRSGSIVVLTLIKGDTVLSPGQFYGDLGPVFDTDSLTFKITKMPDKFSYFCDERNTLFGLFKPSEIKILPEEVEEVKRSYCKSSSLFDIGLLKAYRHLLGLRGLDKEKEVIQSLLFGWLLPRAFSDGRTGSEINDGLVTVMDADVIEPRLAALLNLNG